MIPHVRNLVLSFCLHDVGFLGSSKDNVSVEKHPIESWWILLLNTVLGFGDRCYSSYIDT